MRVNPWKLGSGVPRAGVAGLGGARNDPVLSDYGVLGFVRSFSGLGPVFAGFEGA